MRKQHEPINDTKEIFKNCGTCSRTFAHILNREFSHLKEHEEKALNPLAGGILNLGYQCGMLWGSALAIGAEAYRTYEDIDKAIAITMSATRDIIESFIAKSDRVNCKEIIGYNLKNVFGMARFMLKVTLQGMNNSHCFNLAEQWTPEAIETATKALAKKLNDQRRKGVSCASKVVREMGGTDEEMVMVAGFAGGLGLSGNACGALSAAIWKKMLDWCILNPDKDPPFFNNKEAKKLVKVFRLETNNEILCHKICGQKFESLEEHSAYIENGGCAKLMDALANS